MREIKFRVWKYCHTIEENKFYYLNNLKINRNGGADITFQESDIYYFDDSLDPITDEIIQQYTGLKDKNGVEIYEGDIVKYHSKDDESIEWIALVIFDHYAWRLAHYDGLESGCTSLFPYPGLEVIGNIHENRELLKI